MNGRAYKVMLYLGCVAGVYAGAAVAADRGLDPSQFALLTTALLVPALAGARAWFVVRHPGIYRRDPVRIAHRAEGGAGLFGGLLVGVAVSVPVLRAAHVPFWTFWDAASVTMLVGLILTRLGCLMNGCCAGRRTDSWLGLVSGNVAGEHVRRYPTQLLEAVLAGVVLVSALAAQSRVPDGTVFIAVVAVYCSVRLLLQPLREGWSEATPLSPPTLLTASGVGDRGPDR